MIDVLPVVSKNERELGWLVVVVGVEAQSPPLSRQVATNCQWTPTTYTSSYLGPTLHTAQCAFSELYSLE